VAGGCNLLLGLEPTQVGDDGDDPPDADPDAPDGLAIGHDDDADGIGDVRDLCPHVFDPAQLDEGEADLGLQADGVGDLCDPHPAQSGDVLVFFDAFDGSALGVDYQTPTGTWTVEGDALRQIASGSESDQARAMLPLTDQIEIVGQVTIDVDEVGSTADNIRALGLWAQVPESPAPRPPGYLCVVTIDQQTKVAAFQGIESDGLGNDLVHISTEAPGDPRVGTWTFQISVTPDPDSTTSTIGCTASTGGFSRNLGFADMTYPSGRIGLHVDGLAVTVPNVAVYTVLP
jgi:hypothetical protein